MRERHLLRQLRRYFDLRSDAGVGDFADGLYLKDAAGQLQPIGPQFSAFLSDIEDQYREFDQALDLHRNNLALSAEELLAANDRLREEVAIHRKVLFSLRDTARQLLPDDARDAALDAQDDLSYLSTLVAKLVADAERNRSALAESEARYRRVLASLREVVFKTDWQGVLMFLNPAWQDVTGFTPEESLGMNFTNLIHPDDRDAHLQRLAQLLRQEVSDYREMLRYRTKLGQYRQVEIFARLVKDDEGGLLGIAGTLNDMTEQLAAAEALRQTHQRLEDAVESLDAGFLMLDAQSRVVLSNRRLREQYGALEDQLQPGTNYAEVLLRYAKQYGDPLHKTEAEQLAFVATRLEAIRTRSHEVERLINDQWLRISYHLLPDGGCVSLHTDVTSLKAQAEELLQARDAAEAANRAKSDFLANMSHEIRTPMNGVLGMLQLAQDGQLDDDTAEYIRIAHSSAESLLTVINEILDFSKIESGKLDFYPQAVALDELVYDALKSLATRAHEKGLELYAELSPDLPALLELDPVRIRQILINLVGNAIKFTVTGQIVVRAWMSEQGDAATLRLAVSDSGVGIALNKLEHIFAPFEQADTTTTRHFGGTGLGLTICQRICERAGGRIWVESQPQSGSTFHVSLPARVLDARPACQALVGAPPLRVLLIEAHAEHRRALQQRLVLLGCQVYDYASLAAASQLFTARPDVLPAVDVMLIAPPAGTELAQLTALQMQARLAASHVLLLLHPGRQFGDEQTLRGNHFTVLNKPLANQELSDALLRCLGNDDLAARSQASLLAASRGTVLLVEDNPVNRQIGERMLSKLGCQVVMAEDGESGVQQACNGHFPLVLMDVQMPGMGGLAATQAIRAQNLPQQPIIVAMTARAMADDREACLAAGMNDYLSKPIAWSALASVLDKYLPQPEQAARPAWQRELREARARLAQDPSLWAVLSELLLAEASPLLAQLRVALSGQDVQAASHALRSLSGTLGNVLPRLAHQALHVAQALQAGAELAEQGPVLHSWMAELDAVCRWLVEQPSAVMESV